VGARDERNAERIADRFAAIVRQLISKTDDGNAGSPSTALEIATSRERAVSAGSCLERTLAREGYDPSDRRG
jgi:hypothetical protein